MTKKRTKKGPTLTPAAWTRLQPFLYRKESRQRVILYLVASGYTLAEIIALTPDELRRIPVHPDMEVYVGETLLQRKGQRAFAFPTGAPLTPAYLYRLVRSTSRLRTGKAMSEDQLRQFICST